MNLHLDPIINLELTTPAVILSAASLLLLTYTNRFLTATSRTRELYDRYQREPNSNTLIQIKSQKRRLKLIRAMKVLLITCLFATVLSMFLVYTNYPLLASWIFSLALVFMLASLIVSIREINLCLNALETQLSDLPL
jgi:hypothetical protein